MQLASSLHFIFLAKGEPPMQGRRLSIALRAVLAIFAVTLFVTSTWAATDEKVLHSFNGTDGYAPLAVISDAAGNLYGTTYFGGTYRYGTVFELTPLQLVAVKPCRLVDTRPQSRRQRSDSRRDLRNVQSSPVGPGVPTLNAVDGAVTSNMAIVPTTNGKIDAFASNLTQLIVDISAYFAP